MPLHEDETLRNDSQHLIEDEDDIIITLTNHLDDEAKRQISRITIHYEATDRKLQLKVGSTAKYIKQVADNLGFIVVHKGTTMILME